MADQPDMFTNVGSDYIVRTGAKSNPDIDGVIPNFQWRASPDYLAQREYHEKHFPEQNQRYTTTPEPNAQGELGMSDRSAAAAGTVVHTEWYREALRREAMSDSQQVRQAEDNLQAAKLQEQKQDLDIWDRTAQAGALADQRHQQTQKETQAPTVEEKAKTPTP